MLNKPALSSTPSAFKTGHPMPVPHRATAESPAPDETFCLRQIADIEPLPPDRAWLIDSLWLSDAVGILGGHSKSYKTYLAAELALAVASGTPALGCFSTAAGAGPVLFYGAEDSLEALRARFDGLATARHVSLAALPLYLLDAPAVRLDRERDLHRLNKTIESVKPRLLVLDPFVRLARIDENSATDVAAVLASLRAMQRTHNVAVMVVHHARKSPASHPMNALRGSSDFAAWSDTNLYLARKEKSLTLTIQHRSAASPAPLALAFELEPAPHLVVLNRVEPAKSATPDVTTNPLAHEVAAVLKQSPHPLSTTEIRDRLHKRKADVVAALKELLEQSRIRRDLLGWQLMDR